MPKSSEQCPTTLQSEEDALARFGDSEVASAHKWLRTRTVPGGNMLHLFQKANARSQMTRHVAVHARCMKALLLMVREKSAIRPPSYMLRAVGEMRRGRAARTTSVCGAHTAYRRRSTQVGRSESERRSPCARVGQGAAGGPAIGGRRKTLRLPRVPCPQSKRSCTKPTRKNALPHSALQRSSQTRLDQHAEHEAKATSRAMRFWGKTPATRPGREAKRRADTSHREDRSGKSEEDRSPTHPRRQTRRPQRESGAERKGKERRRRATPDGCARGVQP